MAVVSSGDYFGVSSRLWFDPRHRKYDRRIVLPIPSHSAGPGSEDFQLIGQPEYDECRTLLQRLEGDGSQFVPALNQNESDKEDQARSGIDISGPVMYVFTYALLLRTDIFDSWLNRVPRATGQARRRRRQPLDVPRSSRSKI